MGLETFSATTSLDEPTRVAGIGDVVLDRRRATRVAAHELASDLRARTQARGGPAQANAASADLQDE